MHHTQVIREGIWWYYWTDGYEFISRVIKKLKAKDQRQIDLEKKEQGFTLYLNGANAALKKASDAPRTARTARRRKLKTAGGLCEISSFCKIFTHS